jgi:hypothetical protein
VKCEEVPVKYQQVRVKISKGSRNEGNCHFAPALPAFSKPGCELAATTFVAVQKFLSIFFFTLLDIGLYVLLG